MGLEAPSSTRAGLELEEGRLSGAGLEALEEGRVGLEAPSSTGGPGPG